MATAGAGELRKFDGVSGGQFVGVRHQRVFDVGGRIVARRSGGAGTRRGGAGAQPWRARLDGAQLWRACGESVGADQSQQTAVAVAGWGIGKWRETGSDYC